MPELLLALVAIVALAALPLVALAVALVVRSREARHRASTETILDDLTLRLELLATRVARLETEGPATATPAPAPAAAPAPQAAPLSAAEPPPVAPPSPPSAPAAVVAPPESEPPPRRALWEGWEEKVGARLPVWIGAVALVLAAAVLVEYSLEHGWLKPAVRVALGVLGGVACLVGGQWLRLSSAYVSRGLSAAGVAVLFVSFYAAVNLYALLPPAAGFALMALTTAVAVLLSLRQGVMVATVGLVGGFLTPYLVRSGEPRPAVLFTYLLLLQIGLVVVTRRRRWVALGATTLAAGLLWTVLYLAGPFRPQDTPWVGLFLVASAATFVASVAGRGAGDRWGGATVATGLGWAAGGGGLLAAATLAGAGAYRPLEWLFLGLLAAGCLALARWQVTYHGLAWLAAVVVGIMLSAWRWQEMPSGRYLVTVAAFGALFAAGAYLAHHRATLAGAWCALSATSGVAYLLIAYRAGEAVEAVPWGGVALLLAALYTAAALPVARRRALDTRAESSLAALAVGVTTLVSLALPLELSREWLTVAWALEIPALVWLGRRLEVPVLRQLSWGLLGLVAVRLLLNPAILAYPIGEGLLVNWLTYGYGVPVVALAAGAVLAYRDGRSRLADALTAVAQALLFALATLEVRQYFHPGALGEGGVRLAEWGSLTVAWLALAALFHAGAERWRRPPLLWGERLLIGAAIVQGVGAQCLAANPAWTEAAVGELPVYNRLLWVYGGPALLSFLLARWMAARSEIAWPRFAAIASLFFLFVLVTLEVRQLFRGAVLSAGAASDAERYAYSAAWILLGTALLVSGVALKSAFLRYASLAVMMPTIVKVFLYDTAHLQGLYRVLSLFGLGVSLLLLAFIYQRFVFRRVER